MHLLDPKTISSGRDHSLLHPHLAVRRGFAGRRCDYRTTSRDLFGQHARQQHGRASGRDTANGTKSLFFQTWLERGASGVGVSLLHTIQDSLSSQDFYSKRSVQFLSRWAGILKTNSKFGKKNSFTVNWELRRCGLRSLSVFLREVRVQVDSIDLAGGASELIGCMNQVGG